MCCFYYLLRVFSRKGALSRQTQQGYLSWFQLNTSAENSAKAAVDECGKVANATAVDIDPTRPDQLKGPGRGGPAGTSERRKQCGPASPGSTLDDKSTMGRLLGRIIVTFTTALIFFISYTPQLFIIWPWYGREFSIELFTLLVPFKYDPYKPIYAVPQYSRGFTKHTCRNLAIQLLSLHRNGSGSCAS